MNRRSFLKGLGSAGLLVGFGSFGAVTTACRRTYDFDLLLVGGQVLDGTGAPAFGADVGIKGRRIAAVGQLREVSAYRIVDVSGAHVAPGFIDVHAHSEDELLVNPRAESKVRQGVTTEILGQDGGSVAPLNEEMHARRVERYRDRYNLKLDWRDFAGYFKRLEARGTALNAGSFVGQGTLRRYVLGMEDRPATSEEISEMQWLAAEALDQGALGISSGLEYTPGGFASTEEITELCKVMTERPGLYATHMRNEDDRVLEALEEAMTIARGAGVGLHVSHLKCMGERNWDKLDDVFQRIEAAQSGGLYVTLDRYPYVAYNTGLASLMPLWSRAGGDEAFIARLENEELLPRIKSETLAKMELLGSWDQVMITSVLLEKNRPLQGQTVAQIAAARGEAPFEVVRRLIIEENNRVDMVGFGMSESNTRRVLAHPDCMVASDASALAPYGVLGQGNPHPRSYGTFPRVLGKYVRDEGAMALPEAVRKMTALPATRFRLNGRGQISNGYAADLVVFDAQRVQDRATFAEPHQYPEGISYVFVNGQMVVEAGEHTGQLPGEVIRGAGERAAA